MNPAYLIDTDWAIHYLNGHEAVVGEINRLADEGLALSVISLAELYEGVYYSNDPVGSEDGLTALLKNISVIGIEEDVYKTFGKERGRLRQLRKLIGDFDLLIASTALSQGLTLLTNNRKHFERIKGLNLISA